MPAITYIIKRALKIDRSGLKSRLEELRRITGKPKALIFLDIAMCALLYQSGYVDYTLLGMWELNRAQRKTMLTRGKNNRYVTALNSVADSHFFDNKIDFLKMFSDKVGREYLDLSASPVDDFVEFTKRHPVFIAKPADDMCGNGVEKITSSSHDPVSLYKKLKANRQTLAEELIRQHPVMSSIHPESVNTIRVATLCKGGVAHIVYTGLRCGIGDSAADNFNAGGLTVPINIETGIIERDASTKSGVCRAAHPDTGIVFKGFAVPMWSEVKSLVQGVAFRVSGIKYVGWDVAISESGPILVEGNQFPDNDFFQLRPHTDKTGILPVFDRIYPYKSLKPLNK